ncbi:MAG: winged helix-turn-helix transcriptional regulator [Clostridia bacterium]|nr:winged helix-turn-helix transcriptional regulator [Clostridia bacterium]
MNEGAYMKTGTRHDHRELLERVKGDLPRDLLIGKLSELFAIFADPTRVKLLCALWESEMCVCALTELLGVSQSAVSHALRTLREKNLVKSRREGKLVYYALADEHVRTIITMGLEHLTEKEEASD